MPRKPTPRGMDLPVSTEVFVLRAVGMPPTVNDRVSTRALRKAARIGARAWVAVNRPSRGADDFCERDRKAPFRVSHSTRKKKTRRRSKRSCRGGKRRAALRALAFAREYYSSFGPPRRQFAALRKERPPPGPRIHKRPALNELERKFGRGFVIPPSRPNAPPIWDRLHPVKAMQRFGSWLPREYDVSRENDFRPPPYFSPLDQQVVERRLHGPGPRLTAGQERRVVRDTWRERQTRGEVGRRRGEDLAAWASRILD